MDEKERKGATVSYCVVCRDFSSENSEHRDVSHKTFFSNPAAVLGVGMCALQEHLLREL